MHIGLGTVVVILILFLISMTIGPQNFLWNKTSALLSAGGANRCLGIDFPYQFYVARHGDSDVNFTWKSPHD